MVSEPSTLQKLQAQLLSGSDPSLFPSELGGALKSFLIANKVEEKSPYTLRNYRNCIRGFVLFLEQAEIPATFEVKADDVRLFILSRQEKGIQAITVNKDYRALSRFFTWCIGEGLTNKNPLANIKPPRVPEKEPQPLTKEQINTLLLTQSPKRKSTFLGLRNTALIMLFTDTGLRLSEMANIQLDDYDCDHGQIRVMGKGNKVRVVQMGKRTQGSLLKYLLARTDAHPCLWVTEERRPLTRDGLRIAVKRLFDLAELKGVKHGAHTFRHTFAMEAFMNGAREFDVQLLMGHSTLSMTRRYMKKLNSTHAAAEHHKFSPMDRLGQ